MSKLETTEEEIVFYGWKILYKSEEKPKISLDIEQVIKYKEIIGREKTGNEFQTYINPEGKEISQEAQEITNISPEQLNEAPKFKDVVENAINTNISYPKAIKDIMDKEKVSSSIENYSELKEYLLQRN